MMKNFFSKEGDQGSPTGLMNRQRLLLLGSVVASGIVIWVGSFFVTPKPERALVVKAQKIATPLNSVSPEDRWVSRVEIEAKSAKDALKKMEIHTKLQEDRINNLEKALRSSASFGSTKGPLDKRSPQAPFSQGGSPIPTISGAALSSSGITSQSRSGPYGGRGVASSGQKAGSAPGAPTFIYQSSLSRLTSNPPAKNIDTYIPGGTHARGVLISGLTAYTGVNSTSDPEPLKIRLTDYGVIAKGFKGDIKDAVIIGSCHGEISAERARCRIHTLTLEEANGEIIETPVRGWVMGEDGRGGIRGIVIDRAGEMARAAFGAGLLGGISSFFQKQAQSSVYPVSPFGQTNALKGEDLLKSAGTAGVSNALEKLADYAIKRAEKMEPVIVVDPGRQVDVLFKEGFDLSGTQVRQELHRLGSSKRQKVARQQAQKFGPQTGDL